MRLRIYRARTLAATATAALGISMAVAAPPATAASGDATLTSGMKYTIFDSAHNLYARAYSMGAIWPTGGVDSEFSADELEFLKVGASDGSLIHDGDSVTIKDIQASNIGDLGKNNSWSYSHFFERLGLYAKPDTFKIHLWATSDGKPHIQLTDLTASSLAGNNVKYWNTNFAPAFSLDKGDPDTLDIADIPPPPIPGDIPSPDGQGFFYYSHDSGSADALNDFQYTVKVDTSTATDDVFYAQQLAPAGSSGTMYSGLQPHPNGKAGVRFSIFTVGTPIDSHCTRGADGGAGVTCAIDDLTYVKGRAYTIAMKKTSDPVGDIYTGTIKDETTGQTRIIGAWRVPVGFKGFRQSFTSFIEKFTGMKTCGDVPSAKVSYTNFTINGKPELFTPQTHKASNVPVSDASPCADVSDYTVTTPGSGSYSVNSTPSRPDYTYPTEKPHELILKGTQLRLAEMLFGTLYAEADDPNTQPFSFTSTTPQGYGDLRNWRSGDSAMVKDASTQPGAAVIDGTLKGTPNELWKPTVLSDGTWHFQNLNSGMCLTVPGSAESGRAVQQPCRFEGQTGAASQSFTLK